ncbi:PadR family transcriptional regulator [Paenarthrobacter sp. MMS21-TAE1-1]|uniref:PadR family transcriptional regulator n=1 Tax=Paenarthrobacter aromaticivorans TaxID=2849150 RepID=A0ABS6I384_9MICC|nr:PadR family transcriptional regulator [Paenarthrobacter sp. MMS21-TAE1-1]
MRVEPGASLGRLEVILLSLLSTSARTGYDVRKWLDRHGAYVGYSAQTSQIYRQLGKLVDREWAFPVPDPRNSGPDAKLYQLTDEGRRKLQEWIDSPYEPPLRPLDPDFQVRLRFAGTDSPEKALELVRTELQFRREHRQDHMFTTELAEQDSGPDLDEDERYWREELLRLQSERGLYMVNSLMAWLEATEIRLEAIIRQRNLKRAR